MQYGNVGASLDRKTSQMIYIGEGAVKCVEVAAKSGVAIAVKGRTCLPGDGFDGNLFAVKLSVSIMKMVHILLGPHTKG